MNGVTLEAAYHDAELHAASYEAGDLDAAFRGFTYLKKLQPYDAYFRNMLGSVLWRQQKMTPALQEYIYALSMNPGDEPVTRNALQLLCGFGLHAAALEVYRHHVQVSGNEAAPEFQVWGNLAAVILTACLSKLAGCGLADMSSAVADVFDEIDVPERPWLAKPENGGAGHVLAEARVFISYRHAGGLDYARRLERRLKGDFPSMHVFRDETCMRVGEDFVEQIRDEIDNADILLAFVGRDFVTGGKGHSALAHRASILRRELARAFRRSKVVIPVLLEDASMPEPDEMPDDLKPLCDLHAVHVDEPDFESGFGELKLAMGRLITEKRATLDATVSELKSAIEQWDPETDAGLEKLKPFLQELPKFTTTKLRRGTGVSSDSVELEGSWECALSGPTGQAKLTFTTDAASESPFSGEARSLSGSVGIWRRQRELIKGTWVPVYDDENRDILVGLSLDGLKYGQPFQLFIPFDRRLGEDLVGTDREGLLTLPATWNRNEGAFRRSVRGQAGVHPSRARCLQMIANLASKKSFTSRSRGTADDLRALRLHTTGFTP